MPIQKTTKEEIIWNSIRVFRRKGYYRTKMSDLAKEAGLTKGAFYHHFSNKEEVMRISLQASADWFQRKVFSVAYSPDLSDKEKLTHMADFGYKAFTEELGGCFFANTILETSHVEETFLKEINRFFSMWERALQEILKGKYPSYELGDIVQQIIIDIEGSIILMQLRRDPVYLRRAMQRCIERL